MRAVTNTLHPSAIQYWISVTSPLASDKVSGYKCKKGPKTKIIFLTTGVPVVGRLACYYFLSFIFFFADECLVFLLFVSLVFIYCCIACKARKSFLKMEFVIVVDRVIERNRGDSKKKNAWSDFSSLSLISLLPSHVSLETFVFSFWLFPLSVR